MTGYIQDQIGHFGGQVINDTVEATPDNNYKIFFAIQALDDTVINSVDGNLDISGTTLIAGTVVFGRWSSVQLTSGSVIAYNGV